MSKLKVRYMLPGGNSSSMISLFKTVKAPPCFLEGMSIEVSPNALVWVKADKLEYVIADDEYYLVYVNRTSEVAERLQELKAEGWVME